MNLNLNQRPDVRNELNLSRIVLIAAGVTALLAVIFFVAGNFLPSSDVKASSGPQKYYISGNCNTSANISIMENVEDGDTLELNGDFNINTNCYEMEDVDVVINMKGGDMIFTQDKKLKLGSGAVILCRSNYHLKVENIGITGCDENSNNGDDDVECEDDSCALHQWNTLHSGSSGSGSSSNAVTFEVESTNGYTVTVVLEPTEVNVPGSCTSGYNWTVDLDYTITFSGSNVPSSLWTLQGNLICDGDNDNFFNLPNGGGTGEATTSNSWRSATDCGSITVGSLCEQIQLTIQGPGISSQTITKDIGGSSSSGGTISESVHHPNNDAHEKSNGDMEVNEDYLKVNKYDVGVRFTTVNIPQGADITSAYLVFTAKDDGDGTATVRIKGEDTDDAAAYGSSDDNIGNRTRTTNYTDWSLGDWNEDDTVHSADISSVIQEIVDRSGWSSGNDMAFILEKASGSERKALSYDNNNSTSEAPQLVVVYGDGGSSGSGSGSSSNSGSISAKITDSDNDAHEKSNGKMEVEKDYVYVNKYDVGLRFTSLSLPQGANITSARIVFTPHDDGSGSGSVRFKAQDVDDADAFDDEDDDISDRTRTTNYKDWTLGDWDQDDTVHSPDISDVIQEIVDRSGWASGNDLVVIIEPLSGNGKRKAISWDDDESSTGTCQLIVTYGEDGEEADLTDNDNESAILFGGTVKITPYGTAQNVYSFCEASHSGYSNVEGSLLPVDLVSFEVTNENGTAVLNWVTASEENNSHFEVQRSLNGTDFDVIGEVVGSGNSTTTRYYDYRDENTPAEHFVYYRLRQVDYNGAFEYSPLVMFVGVEGTGEPSKVYPNPADRIINVEKLGSTFSVSLISQTGELVFAEDGIDSRVTIDATNFPRGYYVMSVYNDRFKESHKILIQH